MKNRSAKTFGIIYLGLLLQACSTLPPKSQPLWGRTALPPIGGNCVELDNCIPGPEDIAFDYSQDPTNPRLIVSSFDRWNDDGNVLGGFYWAKPDSSEFGKFNIENTPPNSDDRIILKPHGIHVTKVRGSNKYLLFAVNHPEVNSPAARHEILAFEIGERSLKFRPDLSIRAGNKLAAQLTQPNDLFVTEDGTIYVTNLNDSPNSFGNFLKFVFKQNSGNVLYITPPQAHRTGRILTENVCGPNGVVYLGPDQEGKSVVVVSEIGGNKVTRLEHGPNGENPSQTTLFKIAGGDNFSIEEDDPGYLLMTSHPSMLKFVLHGKLKSQSPTIGYRFKIKDLLNGDAAGRQSWEVVFEDDGSRLGAGSTMQRYRGITYFGRVYGNGVARFE